MLRWLIAVFLFFIFCKPAYADQAMDFIRIVCIPESRYFQFEHKEIDYSSVLTDTEFDKSKRSKRLALWQKHGYFNPSVLQYECRLPGATYKILSFKQPPQARGQCSADYPIRLTLLRNGKIVLDNITFGDDCFGGPSVMSVEIWDGLKGWGERYMKLFTTKETGAPLFCTFLSETYDDISKAIPINQDKVKKYFEQEPLK